MTATPVIAIFDVGKTNKKLFLFNEQYQVVFERSARFTETADEDGDPCENLESLRLSVFDSLREIFRRKQFEVKAINFSTYGASLVYVDEEGQPIAPLYNYLKPYPEALQQHFYDTYGGEASFSLTTASPVLGSLNSGLQLYRIKHQKPHIFSRIHYALHLPQYMSFLLTGNFYADLTSIGCHTALWDFKKNAYHEWVKKEGVLEKLPLLAPCDQTFPSCFPANRLNVGIGLHDSSAALIPYLMHFQEPFVLLSTGTWCISLHPFNHSPLNADELQKDCLCYLTYKGAPVKASRLFAGYEYEQQVKRIADHFHQSNGKYRTMPFQPALLNQLKENDPLPEMGRHMNSGLTTSSFAEKDLSQFASDAAAYHELMRDLVQQQVQSTQLVLKNSPVKRLFVDGGFSKNEIYMNLLAASFPHIEVYAASMAQATALGTALAVHAAWNTQPLTSHLIALQYYAAHNLQQSL